MIAESASMRPVMDLIARVGPSDANVLITGEHGSGKEVVARTLYALSSRSGRPLVTVNAGGLPEGVFESELFGHVKGAFTGASRDSLGFIRAANGGTLFLDEIGELGLHLQSKLLRVLQEKCVIPVGDFKPLPVDVRVVTATNRSLEQMVRQGSFREDLFFRLNVVPLKVPPLRDRVPDIVPLARHFLKTQAELYNDSPKTINTEVVHIFEKYAWPGNVRELANVMEHAHVISSGDEVNVEALPPRLQPASAGSDGNGEEMSLLDVERCTIAKALRRANFNKAAASRLLGINIQRLNRRIIRLGIEIPEA
jgi:transcriptional regulator with PAS, ATPase and Fis domain